MLNGARFRFGGANAANDIGTVGSANGNAYGGTVVSGSYITTHAQVDAYLASASAMKLGVIKATWSAHTTNHPLSVEPTLGTYNAAALDPLDYALSKCAALGIRLVIPLAEQYTVKPWYVSVTGGTTSSNDEFYTRTATINAYKNHISFVLDHVNTYTGVALKDEPAILCLADRQRVHRTQHFRGAIHDVGRRHCQSHQSGQGRETACAGRALRAVRSDVRMRHI
jgi:hypothetical protein